MARNLYGRQQSVKIPIAYCPAACDAHKLRNRRVRSYIDVTLMVKLIPKLIPYINSVLHRPQRYRHIIWNSIAAVEFLPLFILKAQHVLIVFRFLTGRFWPKAAVRP